MISFKNDYNVLAHPDILNLLLKYSNEVNNGYGLDEHSANATKLIKEHLPNNVDIHFQIGGTSANKTVISHILKPYQAVIAVETGHINVHETGAIEATGHKVLTAKGINGKITCEEIEAICLKHTDEHMVEAKLVYISNSTEIGTLYTKDELTKISNYCRSRNLYLFLDGARLGVALTSPSNDLTLKDIARLTDVFYIGGTKNGALLGEAVVISNDDLKANFRYSIKQNGGMLAKGFLIGMQFEGLFTNDLFFKLGSDANLSAQYLIKGLKALNIVLVSDSPTNQQFIKLKNETVKELEKKYSFEVWEKMPDYTVIRLVTSWATKMKDIDELLNDLKALQ